MNKLFYILLLCIISACSSFKEKVGLVKDQPDEYQVISNPPLSIPPDLQHVYSPEEMVSPKTKNEPTNNKSLSKGENIILQNLNKQP